MLELSTYWKVQLALILVISTTYSLISVVGIWVGLSARHWAIRAAVFLLILCPPLFLPKLFHVVAIFVASVLTITTSATLLFRFLRRPQQEVAIHHQRKSFRFSFRLSDLIWFTVAVGALLGTWRFVTLDAKFPTWVRLTTTSVTTSAATFASAWLVLGHSRIGLRIISFACTTTIASLIWREHDWLAVSYCFHDYVRFPLTLPAAVFAILLVWLALGRCAGIPGFWPSFLNRWPKLSRFMLPARCLLLVLALLTIAPTAWIYWSLIQPPPPKEQMLAHPNGFEKSLEICAKFADEYTAVGLSSDEEVVAFVDKHEESLKAIRSSLDMQWQVPLENSDEGADKLYSTMKCMTRALESAAHKLRFEGRINESALCSLDCVRLGTQAANGGLVIHLLNGARFERTAVKQLRLIIASLNVTLCREAIAVLDQIEVKHERLEDVIRREAVWFHRRFGPTRVLHRCIDRIAGEDRFDHIYETVQSVLDKRDSELRLLKIDLAIQAYRQEVGQEPNKLDDLTPNYLSEIPIDPFTQQHFIYAKDSNGQLVQVVE